MHQPHGNTYETVCFEDHSKDAENFRWWHIPAALLGPLIAVGTIGVVGEKLGLITPPPPGPVPFHPPFSPLPVPVLSNAGTATAQSVTVAKGLGAASTAAKSTAIAKGLGAAKVLGAAKGSLGIAAAVALSPVAGAIGAGALLVGALWLLKSSFPSDANDVNSSKSL